MSFKQFTISIGGIINNKHVNTFSGICRHLIWQVRKIFNFFPFEQTISESRIIAKHKRCGVSALINNQGMFDYNNMHFIKMLLKNGGIFFDIGANIGSYSLVASEQKEARIFAFEPHPSTFRLLKENLVLNGRNNVLAQNTAVGSTEGKILFTDEFGSPLNHRVDNKETPEKKLIEVDCLRIDTFCRLMNVLPQFVKIDVEGFEYDVLTGFGDCLEAVDVIFIEINGLSDSRSKGGKDIAAMLINAGLSGPYEFDFDSMTFQRNDSAVEDSVFLSARFSKQCTELGFRLLG